MGNLAITSRRRRASYLGDPTLLKSGNHAVGSFRDTKLQAQVVPDLKRISTATSKNTHRHQTEVGVRVHRAMTFVKHHNSSTPRRRIAAELIANLGNDRCTGSLRSLSHGLQQKLVVQAKIARHLAAIDQKVLSLMQLIKTPVLKTISIEPS